MNDTMTETRRYPLDLDVEAAGYYTVEELDKGWKWRWWDDEESHSDSTEYYATKVDALNAAAEDALETISVADGSRKVAKRLRQAAAYYRRLMPRDGVTAVSLWEDVIGLEDTPSQADLEAYYEAVASHLRAHGEGM